MKKIKKVLLEAAEYAEQNPTVSLTRIAQDYKIDRHTLSDYKNNKTFNQNNLFESHKSNENDFLYFFTDEELEYINYYKEHSNEPYYLLKIKYPKAPEVRAMRNWMDILGNEYFTGALQKYHYDRKKFSNIITEEDAYWLGFITADGCVIENKHLQIKLAKKDRNHLVKFGKYMGLSDDEIKEIIKEGTEGSYTKDNPVVDIKISSVEILRNILDKGIEPRKFGKEKPYICNSISLEKAYIRGILDGDGYLRSTSFGLGVVGSYDICKYIFNFINNNITDISNNHIREHGTIYKLELTGKKQSSEILKYFYKDSNIFLDRKYELYNSIYA